MYTQDFDPVSSSLVVNPDGDALSSLTYNLNWLPATGTLLLISGLITMAILRVSPGALREGARRHSRPAQVGDPHVASVLALA
jgi:lactate permease